MADIPEYVKGVIYTITCVHPDAGLKRYVGQTRTHILNHNKYRPFGAQKRWGQHVSEAKANAPTRQSWKLNNAIRKYGAEFFEVEELGICDLDVLDRFETVFIQTFDSVTNGYNIQNGGRGKGKNSEESSVKAAITLKERADGARLAKYQGRNVKQVRFIRLENKGVRAYVVENGRVTYTSFFGRRSTLEESAGRALAFARSLVGDEKLHIPDSLLEVIRLDD
jgi:hypothetical protein